MPNLQLGILRESKTPPDLRTPLVPEDCQQLMNRFDGLRIVVQPSNFRCFSDELYLEAGCQIAENLEGSTLILGIKEVAQSSLAPGRSYAFFSHTIKAQPNNRSMMQHMVREGITLFDYELMTDDSGRRTVAFGHWAGIVGAWHALRMRCLRFGKDSLPTAAQVGSYVGLQALAKHLALDPCLFLLCGSGRVGQGVLQILQDAGIQSMEPSEILKSPEQAWSSLYDKPAYVLLESKHMVQSRDGGPFDEAAFYQNPAAYQSAMAPFLVRGDLLINSIYWDPRGPAHFEASDIQNPSFRVSQIADISCDIQGSVPITTRATTIQEPYYGVSRTHLTEIPPLMDDGVDLMAVDNLPCELPREASGEFSRALSQHFLVPFLASLHADPQAELPPNLCRARLLDHGALHPLLQHLTAYVGT
ncbi:MAG: NAD(P)-dependent oxidoreductase [Bacteroidota bacterium]